MLFANSNFGIFFWVFLLLYIFLIFFLTSKSVTKDQFFLGYNKKGEYVNTWLLTSSIFISWIFAKSVTNAANLGYSFGIVGGLAYAIYWLSIPFAGWVIYHIRLKQPGNGLIQILVSKFGLSAAVAFSIAILIRLYNEVWSNTAVIGAYFGESGTKLFIFSAIIFTFFTLLYSLRGGLRSSIISDFIQTLIFLLFLFLTIYLLNVNSNLGISKFLSHGSFSLNAGLDLVLVACLQILSYPFHDPVLTDRGFLTKEKEMLRSFIIAGILGFICILLFSFVGIYASIESIEILAKSNIPVDVANFLGISAYIFISVVMITSAGSTLDSTFTSFSKIVAYDLPNYLSKFFQFKSPITIGCVAMVFLAVFGNIPMFLGTDILKATTISGTMVIGLAPVFLALAFSKNFNIISFHASFWSGLLIGILLTTNKLPNFIAIGEGKYNFLLGANLYGLMWCFFVYHILTKLLSNASKKL